MLLNYMFHLRVNPDSVRVAAYSRKIQDSVYKVVVLLMDGIRHLHSTLPCYTDWPSALPACMP